MKQRLVELQTKADLGSITLAELQEKSALIEQLCIDIAFKIGLLNL